jgi:dCMP deaminase
MRQDWHEYFFDIVRVVSTRATCSRASVGAVIVKDNRILATGYNGALSGSRHCEHHLIDLDSSSGPKVNDTVFIDGKERCSVAVHAELNAITDCARRGVACQGAYIYVNKKPCSNCFNAIFAAGIIEVKVCD